MWWGARFATGLVSLGWEMEEREKYDARRGVNWAWESVHRDDVRRLGVPWGVFLPVGRCDFGPWVGEVAARRENLHGCGKARQMNVRTRAEVSWWEMTSLMAEWRRMGFNASWGWNRWKREKKVGLAWSVEEIRGNRVVVDVRRKRGGDEKLQIDLSEGGKNRLERLPGCPGRKFDE
jgi:hypothetical protein